MRQSSLLFFISVFAWLLFPGVLFAATLRFSPSSGTYNVGQTISVSIVVGSTDQAMNATSGVITFPNDLLSVQSISKGGSIIGLWVQEPNFSNTNGSAHFEGVVLNPGFMGGAGTVLTINFKAKAPGKAHIAFDGPQVLANDGQGTDILVQSSPADFVISDSVVKVSPSQKIDSLIIRELGRDTTSPNARFSFTVSSATFSPDHFSVALNNKPAVDFPVSVDNIYPISGGDLGTNTIVVRAVNSAGEFLESKADFYIESLTPPSITEYPSINDGQKPIIIKGTSKYPLSTIQILMRHGNDLVSQVDIVSDKDGGFVYTSSHALVSGEYLVSAKVKKDNGTQSKESTPVSIAIEEPFVMYLGKIAINIFFSVLILLLIILLLTITSMYLWYKFRAFRKRVRKEGDEAEASLKKSLKLLKEEVGDVVASKTAQEELRSDIDDVEKYVGKEIKDIQNLK